MTAYLFSCENATCAVPEAYREIFRGSEEEVASAEGWEPGSLNLAQAFAMRYRTPLLHGDVTRLLMDFEKAGDKRWSRFSLKLPEATRLKIVDRHERPYRTLLVQRIAEDLRRHAAVLHVMVHTDPAMDGWITLKTPKGGVLAQRIAKAWQARLKTGELDVHHVRNAASVPLGTALSLEFPAAQYAQIRLSVSQSFFLEGRPWRWEPLKKLLMDSLEQAVADIELVSDPEFPSIAPY
ncbi:MAG: hypothetical protein NTV46_01700 [Verrucomicrobia bacterium]|nr:hypothetical protein [Verrucomicrobiota bacterium]